MNLIIKKYFIRKAKTIPLNFLVNIWNIYVAYTMYMYHFNNLFIVRKIKMVYFLHLFFIYLIRQRRDRGEFFSLFFFKMISSYDVKPLSRTQMTFKAKERTTNTPNKSVLYLPPFRINNFKIKSKVFHNCFFVLVVDETWVYVDKMTRNESTLNLINFQTKNSVPKIH